MIGVWLEGGGSLILREEKGQYTTYTENVYEVIWHKMEGLDVENVAQEVYHKHSATMIASLSNH